MVLLIFRRSCQLAATTNGMIDSFGEHGVASKLHSFTEELLRSASQLCHALSLDPKATSGNAWPKQVTGPRLQNRNVFFLWHGWEVKKCERCSSRCPEVQRWGTYATICQDLCALYLATASPIWTRGRPVDRHPPLAVGAPTWPWCL